MLCYSSADVRVVSESAETTQRVCENIRAFSENPERARQQLKMLLATDPIAFRSAAIAGLRTGAAPACRTCLIELMWAAGMLPVCDPDTCSLDEELAVVRELAVLEPGLDLKLARRFAEPLADHVALRILELLSAIARDNRVLPFIIRLVQDPNPHLRSKAALLVARSNMAPEAAARLFTERDPRVRANATEALWGSTSPAARALFREAVRDGSNRVAGNALLGLYLLGDTTAIPQIMKLAAHPDPLFRATAAWVMERTGNPRFVPVLEELLRSSQAGARNRVFRALSVLKRTAARFQEAARLRVHLLSASAQRDGVRSLRAAIATTGGDAIPDLAPTGVVVWEHSQPTQQYNVRSLPVPGRFAIGLYFPEGETGDRAVAALEALRRASDEWVVSRYAAGSADRLQQVFASLGTVGVSRHVFVYAGQIWSPGFAPAASQPILTQAHALGLKVHAVGLAGAIDAHGLDLARLTGGFSAVVERADQIVAAYEKMLVGLQRLYEIEYVSPAGATAPSDIRLEVYSGAGYGFDVLRAA